MSLKKDAVNSASTSVLILPNEEQNTNMHKKECKALVRRLSYFRQPILHTKLKDTIWESEKMMHELMRTFG